MAQKLYYSSPETAEWQTEITQIMERSGSIFVTLKETAFYPEGGGQPWDLGYIENIEVLEVIEEGGEIFHKIPKLPLHNAVTCKLDVQRRIEHTQNHTGQHLLSAVCRELFEAETVSFHLGKEYTSIDLDIPSLEDSQLERIEAAVNKYIYENRSVKTFIIEKDQLSNFSLRKLPIADTNIRIVDIEGIDCSACCGTHVSRTGEIGLMKLLKTEKHRGNTRLYFKCGFRALEDYKEKHSILSQLTARLSASPSLLEDRIDKMESLNKELQKKLEELQRENARYTAYELLKNQHGELLTFIHSHKPLSDCERIALEAASLSSKIIAAASESEKKFILTHNGEKDFHCGNFLKNELPAFNGKGGGGKIRAQAAFQSLEEMNQFLEFIKSYFN